MNENPQPNPNPEPTPTPTPPAGAAGAPPQPTTYETLMKDKGFKDNEGFASSYGELEKSHGKHTTTIDTAKKQLEAHGMTMDEKGNITNAPAVAAAPSPYDTGMPGYVPPAGQPGYAPPAYQPPAYQPPAEPVIDAYGNRLTNPVDIMMSKMPPSQAMALVAGAVFQNQQKLQSASYTAEAKILSEPSAKEFADDTRKVMMALPLQQRATEQAWSDALLRVKGAHLDKIRVDAGAQGVHDFLNKAKDQGAGGQPAAGAAGATTLTEEQEQNYKYYETNHPGMFKDRAHFLQRANSNLG